MELQDDVRALFDGANPAHIATLLPDGAPHSVPVWVALEADRIAFLTQPDVAQGSQPRPRPARCDLDHRS